MERNKTFIIVTHDLRFVTNFEQIIVLESGQVVGQGTHDELLNNNEYYKKMWNLDLTLSNIDTAANKPAEQIGRKNIE